MQNQQKSKIKYFLLYQLCYYNNFFISFSIHLNCLTLDKEINQQHLKNINIKLWLQIENKYIYLKDTCILTY